MSTCKILGALCLFWLLGVLLLPLLVPMVLWLAWCDRKGTLDLDNEFWASRG